MSFIVNSFAVLNSSNTDSILCYTLIRDLHYLGNTSLCSVVTTNPSQLLNSLWPRRLTYLYTIVFDYSAVHSNIQHGFYFPQFVIMCIVASQLEKNLKTLRVKFNLSPFAVEKMLFNLPMLFCCPISDQTITTYITAKVSFK